MYASIQRHIFMADGQGHLAICFALHQVRGDNLQGRWELSRAMIYLAAPYDKMSDLLPGSEGGLCREIIAPYAFTESLASGPAVPLVRGHERRKHWRMARVRCFEMPNGLYFDFAGELPADFTGFSVRFRALRWLRVGNAAFRLTETRLKHIALLTAPDVPAYPSTFTYVRNHERFAEIDQKEERQIEE